MPSFPGKNDLWIWISSWLVLPPGVTMMTGSMFWGSLESQAKSSFATVSWEKGPSQIYPSKCHPPKKETYHCTAKDMTQYPNCFCRTVMRRHFLGSLLQSPPHVKTSRDKSMLHSLIGWSIFILLSSFFLLFMGHWMISFIKYRFLMGN